MRYRLLLDENVEHELLDRLRDAGHDVEHVDTDTGLEKSTDDETIAAYASETNRLVVTYDDDFVKTSGEMASRGALYVPDTSLRSKEIAAIVEEISRHYPQEAIDGFVFAGTGWL